MDDPTIARMGEGPGGSTEPGLGKVSHSGRQDKTTMGIRLRRAVARILVRGSDTVTRWVVRLLGESGVTHMGFGTESASQKVLKLMNKHHQHVEQMVGYPTAKGCTRFRRADIQAAIDLA